jgi:16S rRNA processing protein RimM
MAGDEYRLLGSVVKTKGIAGEIIIRTKISADSIQAKQRFVMVKIDGLLVPFYADSWHNNSKREIVLKIRDISTRDKAENFRDKEIWLPAKEFRDPGSKNTAISLTGYKVIDASNGFIGITKGILEIPGNDLLQVDYREREILIPIQGSIILEINADKKQIKVSLPEGFLKI